MTNVVLKPNPKTFRLGIDLNMVKLRMSFKRGSSEGRFQFSVTQTIKNAI